MSRVMYCSYWIHGAAEETDTWAASSSVTARWNFILEQPEALNLATIWWFKNSTGGINSSPLGGKLVTQVCSNIEFLFLPPNDPYVVWCIDLCYCYDFLAQMHTFLHCEHFSILWGNQDKNVKNAMLLTKFISEIESCYHKLMWIHSVRCYWQWHIVMAMAF